MKCMRGGVRSWDAVSASHIHMVGHWHRTDTKGGENPCSFLDFWWAASKRELVIKSLGRGLFSVDDTAQMQMATVPVLGELEQDLGQGWLLSFLCCEVVYPPKTDLKLLFGHKALY